MERMQAQYVDINGARLFAKVGGPEDGKLVLLQHGFPETHWSWRYQVPALLDAGYKVVVTDLRGTGDSGIKGPFHLQQLAEDVIALVDHYAGGHKALLMGHDWGGTACWEAARLAPEKIAGYVAVNCCLPEVLIDRISIKPDRRQFMSSLYIYAFQVPLVPEMLLSWRGGKMLGKLIRGASVSTERFGDAELKPFREALSREGVAKGMFGPYRDTLRKALRDLFFTGDPYPRRGRVRVPVLLYWGAQDPALSFESLVEPTKTQVDEITVVEMPNVGHFAHEEAPKRIEAGMLEFFEACLAR